MRLLRQRQQDLHQLAVDEFVAADHIAGLKGIAGGIEAFFSAVTDGKLWRSLGWLLLGIILIIAGVYLWIVPGAANKALAVKSAVA